MAVNFLFDMILPVGTHFAYPLEFAATFIDSAFYHLEGRLLACFTPSRKVYLWQVLADACRSTN